MSMRKPIEIRDRFLAARNHAMAAHEKYRQCQTERTLQTAITWYFAAAKLARRAGNAKSAKTLQTMAERLDLLLQTIR